MSRSRFALYAAVVVLAGLVLVTWTSGLPDGGSVSKVQVLVVRDAVAACSPFDAWSAHVETVTADRKLVQDGSISDTAVLAGLVPRTDLAPGQAVLGQLFVLPGHRPCR